MRLSQNFTLNELTYSDTAKKYKIDNTPSKEVIKNLGALVANVLQPLRDKLGKPIIITSGYRCSKLNSKIGGSNTSQHLTGQAADIIVRGMKVEDLYSFIKKSGIVYDQLIQEHSGNTTWVHISYCTKLNRKQNLIYKNNHYILDLNRD